MSAESTGVPEEVEAGRETDERIAVEVMGLCVHDWDIRAIELDEWDAHCRKCGADRGGTYGMLPPNSSVPKFSTEIKEAWRVVERLAERFTRVDVGLIHGVGVCAVEDMSGEVEEHYVAVGEADTAPLAICRAALAATTPQPEQRISTPTPPRNP